jgi:ABC-type nitrate/sulfonate/bicarbonate transport system substrate-binding protein
LVAQRAVRAALCALLLLSTAPARAAEKVVAGTLGGQAPLWPFYVAIHKGFFAAEGIDLELNFGHSGAAVTQQLTGGSLDVALSVGITDPIHAIDKGAPLALIRIIGRTPPYVLIGRPGLKTIADLKGKIVSSGQAADITTVYLDRMMSANGLKKGDYDVISAGVAAARFAAVKAGAADAALVLPPLNYHAAAEGYPTLGLTADYVKDLPFTGMAVLRPWAEAHLALARKVLAVTDRSMAWFADPAHRTEAIDLLVKVAHAERGDAEASYDYLAKIAYFEPQSAVSRAKLQNLIAIERRAGNVEPGLTVERLVMPGLTQLTD